MKKPVLGIALEFGFHEIKKFIHSGFTAKLAREFDIVWFLLDKKNEVMEAYFHSTGFPIVHYQPEQFKKENHFCEQCNSSVRQAWMKNKEAGVFHNYKKIQTASWKDKLLGLSLFKKLFEHKTLWIIQQRYLHATLADDFKRYNITHVLSTGYASAYAKYFFTTAHQLKLPCYHVVNSWKDLYTNNFLGYDFLQKIFVWNESMKEEYLQHMPYLKADTLCVTGNPTFDACITHQPKPRQVYSAKYKLHETSQWLLYTMMPPGLVNDEWDTILAVAAELDKYYTDEKVQIIVRKNPNHNAEAFTQVLLPKNIVLAEHYCSYDAKTDMIVQTQEGEEEWLDLLHHAVLNMSVPSTVTMEFLVMQKAVINIGFDASGLKDDRVTQHFEAGFYRNLFDKENVFRVNDMEALMPALRRALSFNALRENNPSLTLASDRVVQELLHD